MNLITGENIADLYHRSAAVVDLACISHNLQVVREKAPGRKIIAMVKANAYGHGLVRVAEHLASEGVDYLGTAFVESYCLYFSFLLYKKALKAYFILPRRSNGLTGSVFMSVMLL